MSFDVYIDASAFIDARFGYLAKLLNLSCSDEARGKVAFLVFQCADRNDRAPLWLVAQIFGEAGGDALVQSELASPLNERELELHIDCMWTVEAQE